MKDNFLACLLSIMLTAVASAIANHVINAATEEYWRLYVIGASAQHEAGK